MRGGSGREVVEERSGEPTGEQVERESRPHRKPCQEGIRVGHTACVERRLAIGNGVRRVEGRPPPARVDGQGCPGGGQRLEGEPTERRAEDALTYEEQTVPEPVQGERPDRSGYLGGVVPRAVLQTSEDGDEQNHESEERAAFHVSISTIATG